MVATEATVAMEVTDMDIKLWLQQDNENHPFHLYKLGIYGMKFHEANKISEN